MLDQQERERFCFTIGVLCCTEPYLRVTRGLQVPDATQRHRVTASELISPLSCKALTLSRPHKASQPATASHQVLRSSELRCSSFDQQRTFLAKPSQLLGVHH